MLYHLHTALLNKYWKMEEDNLQSQIRKLKEDNIRLRAEVHTLKKENTNLQRELNQSQKDRQLPYKDVLRQCHIVLVLKLDPSHSLDVLVQEKKITTEQSKEIKAGMTRRDEVRRLVDLLMKGSPDCFEVFLESLKQSNDYLWSFLTEKIDDLVNDKDTSRYLTLEDLLSGVDGSSTSGDTAQLEQRIQELEKENIAIKEENQTLQTELQTLRGQRDLLRSDSVVHREVLIQSRISLIQNLDPTHPIDLLLQEMKISREEAGKIQAGAYMQDKARRLVDLLHMKGFDCFKVFLEALKESNESLCSCLTNRLDELCSAKPATFRSVTPPDDLEEFDDTEDFYQLQDQSPSSLHKQPWYHPNIDRDWAENWLAEKEVGTFLVRHQRNSQDYAISIRKPTKVIHVKIVRVGDSFEMHGYAFESVQKIIDYLKTDGQVHKAVQKKQRKRTV